MPGTHEEFLQIVTGDAGIVHLTDVVWADGTVMTEQEFRDVTALRAYHFRLLRHRERDRKPQRRAMKTLRTFLSREQRRQLRASKYFFVSTSSGRTYRMFPATGLLQRMSRHGSRWYGALAFCLHDDQSKPEEMMPPADVSLAHLLMLNCDEMEVISKANIRAVRTDLWNGQYLRRLRQARAEREIEEREATP